MNTTLHRSRPYSSLSEQDLARYPTVTDIEGNVLRVDGQGILYESRNFIVEPPTQMMIDRAVKALRKVHVVTVPKVNGYILRGHLETVERCGWIPLGALILGAHQLEIPMRWSKGSPNVRLAVSRKWLKWYLGL